MANATFATSAGSATTATTAGTVTTAAQANITSVGVLTSLSSTGNITGANITGTHFGSGAALSSITGANVTGTVANATFATSAGSATTATTAGTANSVAGANVTGTVANATFATSAGSATTATTAGTVTTNAQPNITSTGTLTSLSVSGNTTSGNLLTPGMISASGNITTAGYFIGNFAGNITGNLTVPGANTNVLFNNQGNAGASTNFTFDSATNVMNVTGSATVTGTITGGNISTAGNVTGAYIFGNGSQLTGLPAGYSNANATTLLAAFGSNTISTTGNITSGNLNVTVDAVITGNLTVNGTTTTVNSNTVTINDKFINVANNASTAAAANGGGLGVGPVGGEYATLTYNSTNNDWNTNIALSVNGNVTAGNFVGSGAALSAITGANVTGTVANATFATSAGSANTANTATFAGTANAVAGANVSGTVANATYALNSNAATYASVATFADTANAVAGANVSGTVANATFATAAGTASSANTAVTVTGNAQANITSVGILTSLSVSGNINGSNVNASTVQATTSAGLSLKNSAGTTQASMGAGGSDNFTISVSTNINGANAQIDISPTGNSGHVHIKPTGLNSVEIAPTYPGSINNMVIGNITPAAVSATTVSASGNITAAYISGNGSLLSALTGANVTGTVANATYATAAGSATTATTANTVTDAAQANITSVGTLTGLSVSGNTTSGNLLTAGQVSATGNITGSYILGNGSQLTGITASANAAGSNTQIQYNNGGAFAGNANLTFDQVTGNFTAGNIVTVGSTINSKNAFAFSPANTLLALNNARIVVGNGYDGNTAVQYDPLNVTRGSRLAVMDKGVYNYTANSLQSGTRLLTSYFWLDLDGTTVGASASSRNSAGAFVTNVGNGSSAQTGIGFYGVQSALAIGNATSTGIGNIGNATLNIGVGQGSFVQVYNGSTANTAVGTYSSILVASVGGVIGNSIGYAYNRADAANNSPTWNIGYFHPDNVATFGSSMAGNARLATNYYAFYNKDNFADVQLGSLRSFHHYTSNVLGTGGSQAISKANGQYQTTTGNLTANLDITSFTNFATSNTVTSGSSTGTKLSSDVVTLLVPMGATPYSINMPTGNTSIKYVGNISTVTGPANSITQVQITGSNVGGTVQYLVNMENSGSNILTDGVISATGNITGGNVISLGRSQAVNFSETVYAFGNATGTITPNISLGAIQSMTVTGNITLNAITNIATGQSMTLILTQDATGGRTLTSTMKFAGNSRTLSTAAAATDIISVFYDGTNYWSSLTKGYA